MRLCSSVVIQQLYLSALLKVGVVIFFKYFLFGCKDVSVNEIGQGHFCAFKSKKKR